MPHVCYLPNAQGSFTCIGFGKVVNNHFFPMEYLEVSFLSHLRSQLVRHSQILGFMQEAEFFETDDPLVAIEREKNDFKEWINFMVDCALDSRPYERKQYGTHVPFLSEGKNFKEQAFHFQEVLADWASPICISPEVPARRMPLIGKDYGIVFDLESWFKQLFLNGKRLNMLFDSMSKNYLEEEA